MRGVFLKKPFEYTLEIEGESWKQEEIIRGQLHIKNHGDISNSIEAISIALQKATTKKVKEKSQDAFFPLQTMSISPKDQNFFFEKGEITKVFQFQIDANAPITEKSQGLYITCGNINSPFDGGILEVQVFPADIISYFLRVFTDFFKFQVKSLKYKKNSLEAKMLPPKSKDLGAVEQLLLNISLTPNALHLNYHFKIEKLATENGLLMAKKDKIIFDSQIEKSKYSLGLNDYNSEEIQKSITETLEFIKRKTTF